MSDSFEEKVSNAIKNPKNLGELKDADAVGTAGSPGCGDMLRIWLKYKNSESGEKVIDKASFQSFGCETAIAVASLATEMLEGKKIDEAKDLTGTELSKPLGALPPMKVHCATLVEEALRQALEAEDRECAPMQKPDPEQAGLIGEIAQNQDQSSKGKIVFLEE